MRGYIELNSANIEEDLDARMAKTLYQDDSAQTHHWQRALSSENAKTLQFEQLCQISHVILPQLY